MCSCNKGKTSAAGATAKPKPVTVAYPDGTKKSYNSETEARVAAAQKNGRLVSA